MTTREQIEHNIRSIDREIRKMEEALVTLRKHREELVKDLARVK